ncbi:MAG: hypothetical protein SFU56_16545 [Capsulimonadales bacterium]|nr:hypothetical protein [Capsulimonadales bacterium]
MNHARDTEKLFEEDAALNRVVRLPKGICRQEKLLLTAGRTSRRALRSNSPGLIYYATVEGVSVRAIMDAVASVYGCGWRRDSPTEYRLITPLSMESVFFENLSDEQKAAYAAGEAFFRHFDRLPAERKQALFDSDKMVNVRDLPEPMEDWLKRMVDQVNQDMDRRQEKDGGSEPRAVPADEVHAARISIEPGDLANFREYAVRVEGPTGFIRFAIFLKQPPMRREETTDPSAPVHEVPDDRPIYRPQDVEAREANKRSESYGRKGSVRGDALTLNQALKLVHITYKIPVLAHVSSYKDRQKVTKNLRIENLPLRDAMDRITTLYGDSQTRIDWYPGRYGVLVVRGFPL